MEPSKKDWKLFMVKLPDWQETYMEKLVKEYMVYLNSNLPASSKFWELEKKIKADKKKPGVILELRKSNMLFDLINLINDGVIRLEDLSNFTDELQENVKILIERMNYVI